MSWCRASAHTMRQAYASRDAVRATKQQRTCARSLEAGASRCAPVAAQQGLRRTLDRDETEAPRRARAPSVQYQPDRESDWSVRQTQRAGAELEGWTDGPALDLCDGDG